MAVIPTPVPPFPGELPNRSDPSTFSPRADEYVEYEEGTLRPGINQLAEETYDNAVAAHGSAVAAGAAVAAAAQEVGRAQDAANEAEAAAQVAQQAAGATQWESGETYSPGDVVWSPITLLNYRRITAGGGAIDPSLDSDNWSLLGINLALAQAVALSLSM